MTEIYGLFDAADPMDPDRVYTAEAFARLFKTMMRDGIVHNDGDELAVGPTVPAAMSVSVGTGMALIQGRYYINDSDLTLNVEAADPSHPRIDRVVVRLEATPGRTVHAVVKKGTPAPSPVPPGLTRTAETWELSLAQVRVEAGATSIVAGKITDERGNTSLCGVAAPVYVPSSQLEVVGAVDMQGKALTGLPAPSGSTDAARKGYVDSELAAKIGGFGISQIAIDANKDWGGKSITNVGTLSAESLILPESPFIIVADTTKDARYLLKSDDAEAVGSNSEEWRLTKSLPPLPASVLGTENSVYVSYQHRSGDTYTATAQIYVNGVGVGTTRSTSSTSYTTWDEVITGLKAGDVIQIYTRALEYATYYVYVRNLRVYGVTFKSIPMTPGIW